VKNDIFFGLTSLVVLKKMWNRNAVCGKARQSCCSAVV